MKDIQLLIGLCTMLVGLIWISYDLYLSYKILPSVDAKNQHMLLLRADSRFAKVSRSGVYMFASTLPGLFKYNKRKYLFYATELERFLYRIDGYLFLMTILGCCLTFFIDWLLDHQLYWW